MLIKSLITPANILIKLSTEDTAEKAIEIIENNGFLSLPVFKDNNFFGFLSKQFIYDQFFKSGSPDVNSFFQKPVSDFITSPQETVKDNIHVEEAAEIFFKSKVRFLPVVDSNDKFVGILTQKALFEVILKIFGLQDAKIVILSSDFSGVIAKIAEIIHRQGANITNIVQMDTGVMGIQEISIRLEGKNLEKLVDKLKSSNINVREFIPAK